MPTRARRGAITRAVMRSDSSVSSHLERRLLAVQAEINSAATELSKRQTGRPGPKPGLKALRLAHENISEARRQISAASKSIDRFMKV